MAAILAGAVQVAIQEAFGTKLGGLDLIIAFTVAYIVGRVVDSKIIDDASPLNITRILIHIALIWGMLFLVPFLY